MSLGIMVTMNQRLDAETLTIVADEFGYEVQFITTDIEENFEVIEDDPKDLTHHCTNRNRYGTRRSRKNIFVRLHS